jgi:carbonic anhydrase
MKIFEDLERIKERNQQIQKDIKGDEPISKKEQKKIDKLIKEKDKLDRDAMILRIKEKDDDKVKNKVANIVENPITSMNLTEEDKLTLIP